MGYILSSLAHLPTGLRGRGRAKRRAIRAAVVGDPLSVARLSRRQGGPRVSPASSSTWSPYNFEDAGLASELLELGGRILAELGARAARLALWLGEGGREGLRRARSKLAPTTRCWGRQATVLIGME